MLQRIRFTWFTFSVSHDSLMVSGSVNGLLACLTASITVLGAEARAQSSQAHEIGLQIGDDITVSQAPLSGPRLSALSKYQKHGLLCLEEEAPQAPFPLGPCHLRVISIYSGAAVSHQLAITSGKTAIPMVCICSPGQGSQTVPITISSRCSCIFHPGHRCWRIVSFWGLCIQHRISKQ